MSVDAALFQLLCDVTARERIMTDVAEKSAVQVKEVHLCF
jgi:hypothetical protein